MTDLSQAESRGLLVSKTGSRTWLQAWLTRPTSKSLVMNVAILIALCVWFSIDTSEFMTTDNLSNLIRQVAFVGIAACAVTPVMVAGGLDLSIGSIVAVAGVVAAKLVAAGTLSLGLAFGVGVVAGGLVGAVNAFLVVGMRINPVIATLGTMYVGRGVANVIADGSPVTGVPLSFNNLATGKVGPISTPVFIFAVIAIVMIIVERKTLLGRWVIASGGNEEAARLSGIPVNRTRAIFYVLSGLAAGIAGILINSRVATGDPNSGTGFEFDVIVAVVLGGTAITGGVGTIVGAIVGVLIVGVLDNGLNLMGVDTFYQSIVLGTALIFAVGTSAVFGRGWRGLLRR
jgi:ribose/xylose/arabinose/galactoside ABC-type transport system permease subunit